MDEVLLIDKPAGMTSFGVVARLRRVLSQAAGKKVKVGHTGTLDPFATGLMIIVTARSVARLIPLRSLISGMKQKSYLARYRRPVILRVN